MADVNITVEVSGLDRAIRSLDRLERALDDVRRSGARVAATLRDTADAIDTMTDAVELSTSVTKKAAKEQVRFRQVLHSVNSRIRNVTDSIRDVTKKVRRWSKSAEAIEKSAEAIDTQSTAQEVSTRKTKEATEAQSTLRKVLHRVNVNLTRLGGKLRVFAAVTGIALSSIVALREEMAALGAAIGGVLVRVQLEAAEQRLNAITESVEQTAAVMRIFRDITNETGTRLTGLVDQMAAVTASTIEAGRSFRDARQIMRGFISAQSRLGGTTDEIADTLESLNEIVKDGQVDMADLRDVVSFTNDPVETLARAFGTTEQRIQQLIDSGRTLSSDALVPLASHLETNVNASGSLSDAFNRLINAVTTVLQRFNQTGVIRALIDLMGNLADVIRSDVVVALIERLGRGMTEFLRSTLPNFARGMIENWESILDVIRGVAGALIGLAGGGIVGGLIGGIIGGHDKLREAVLSAAGSFGEFAFDVIRFMNGAREDVTREAQIVGRALSGIAETATLAAQAIITGFTAAGKTIGGVSAAVVAAAKGDFRRAGIILNDMANDLQGEMDELQSEVAGAVDRLGDLARQGTSTTSDMLDLRRSTDQASSSIDIAAGSADTANQAATRLSLTVENLTANFGHFLNVLGDAVTDFGTLEEAARRVGNTIRQSFTTAFADTLKGVKSLGDALEDAFKSIVDAIIEELARLAAHQVFKLVLNLVGLKGGDLSNPGSGLSSGFAQSASSAIASSLGSGAVEAGTGATAGLSLGSLVSTFVGGGLIAGFAGALSDVFQTGGSRVVSSPTMIGVGEHNQPEKVTVEPLSGASRGGGVAPVVIQGPAIFDDISMNRFARRIGDAQRRQARRSV